MFYSKALPVRFGILSCLTAASVASVAATTTADVHDVIIVGAGWSGLAAGNYLMEAGITENILILEARDRIGGRSYTQQDAFQIGHPVELGSAWIYPDTNVYDLVTKLGITHDTTHYTFQDDSFGLFDSLRSGSELRDDEKYSLIDELYLDDFVKYAEKMAKDDVSWTDIKESYFADHNLGITNANRQAINALVQTGIIIEFGGPLNELNSETTQKYLTRGDWRDIEFMAVAGGTGGGYTGALTRGLTKSLENKIKTNTPVIKIKQNGDIAEVYTSNGQVIYTRSVIVTVPLGVLKKSAIEFVPPLSDEKLEAIDLIGMGTMNKVIMYWDDATQDVSWWPEGKVDMTLITDHDADSGEWTYFYNDQNHAPNNDYHVLTSWNGGDTAKRLEQKSDEETMDIVLGNLRTMFGSNVPAPQKYIITRWGSDEFSQGSYSYDTVGVDTAKYRQALAEPIGNVFFAGEATDTVWFGTAVGAYTTGVNAAIAIGDSGMLEAPSVDFQPVCTPMHGSCGGQFDEACCSGLSCVVDDRLAPMPPFDSSLSRNSHTIEKALRRICSPAQRKKDRERNRIGTSSISYRTNRSNKPGSV